jgi:hypothetical protein
VDVLEQAVAHGQPDGELLGQAPWASARRIAGVDDVEVLDDEGLVATSIGSAKRSW